MRNNHRVHIITGHYGSGKTEFAMNYAFKKAEKHNNIVIGDMDIVNPYFRSREKKVELEEKGIRLVSSSSGYSSADVPALSPEIYGILQDEKLEVILDVGGDPSGARVLGRYHEYFQAGNYDMWMVVNANRPNTQNAKDVLQYIKEIQDASRISITGLINNTHMIRETSKEDIIRGNHLVEEVSRYTELPIVFTSVLEEVVNDLPKEIKGDIFPIKLKMRPEWL
jgi:hypothetical protein